MSGIVGSYHNIRGSGVVAKLGTDGQVFTSAGAGLAQGFEAAAGGGKLLQVVQYVTTAATVTSSATSFTDISGFAQAITPTAASSKILVDYRLAQGAKHGNNVQRITRDIDGAGYSEIFIGDAAGSRSRATAGTLGGFNQWFMTFGQGMLDSPSYTLTDVITYQIQWRTEGSAHVSHVNKSDVDADSAYNARVISTMTLMEIGA